MTISLFLSALAALASWIALLLTVRTARKARLTAAKAALDEVRKRRNEFWTATRRAYRRFRKERDDDPPEDIRELISLAGMPPGLPHHKYDLAQWYDDYERHLNQYQKTMWDFVTQVYPSRQEAYKSDEVMTSSIVDREHRISFHSTRQELSTFYFRWTEELGVRRMAKEMSFKASIDEVILLSWLEVALANWIRGGGSGKLGLFKLGKKLSQ